MKYNPLIPPSLLFSPLKYGRESTFLQPHSASITSTMVVILADNHENHKLGK
jgi:hypothetical protein